MATIGIPVIMSHFGRLGLYKRIVLGREERKSTGKIMQKGFRMCYS